MKFSSGSFWTAQNRLLEVDELFRGTLTQIK